jgi:hypothetical protein
VPHAAVRNKAIGITSGGNAEGRSGLESNFILVALVDVCSRCVHDPLLVVVWVYSLESFFCYLILEDDVIEYLKINKHLGAKWTFNEKKEQL